MDFFGFCCDFVSGRVVCDVVRGFCLGTGNGFWNFGRKFYAGISLLFALEFRNNIYAFIII